MISSKYNTRSFKDVNLEECNLWALHSEDTVDLEEVNLSRADLEGVTILEKDYMYLIEYIDFEEVEKVADNFIEFLELIIDKK